jgi:hypothetical protein
MNDQPSTHGGNGKDAKGRFVPGNKLGRGNPLAGRAAAIRAVLLLKLTPKDAGTIAEKLISMAISGDLAAIREILDRTIGKPVARQEVSGPDGEPIRTEGKRDLSAYTIEELEQMVAIEEAVEARKAAGITLDALGRTVAKAAGTPASKPDRCG